MGGISMTIGEKASEYAEKSFPSDDISNSGKHDVAFHSYSAGANWMIDKAVKWLKENAQNYYKDSSMHDNCWYNDEQMIEDFQKAMEE